MVVTMMLVGAMTIALAPITGCAAREKAAGFRVGLVTPGSITDAAWNSGAYRGLEWIRDSMNVAVSQVEARTPSEQEEALRAYASQGYALVFGHGFEFQGAAERVSSQFPTTTFIVTSGERVTGNVSPMVFRLHEASYLAGIVAGGMTQTNIIAFIGGIELPPIRLAEEAWVAGARSVNPRVEARSTYLNTFDDVAAGREAALALLRAGADMFHHNADQAALGMFQAVRESANGHLFGANLDQMALAPNRVYGSAVIDLPRAFLSVARQVEAGTFVPQVESFGLKSGVIRYDANPALEHRIPDAIRQRLSAARDSIIANDGADVAP
jgi:basic membrane protein A